MHFVNKQDINVNKDKTGVFWKYKLELWYEHRVTRVRFLVPPNGLKSLKIGVLYHMANDYWDEGTYIGRLGATMKILKPPDSQYIQQKNSDT